MDTIDNRIYGLIMPMASMKSTVFKMPLFNNVLLDVDVLLTQDESLSMIPHKRVAMSTGDWTKHNDILHSMLLENFLKYNACKNYAVRVVMVHSYDMCLALKLTPYASVIPDAQLFNTLVKSKLRDKHDMEPHEIRSMIQSNRQHVLTDVQKYGLTLLTYPSLDELVSIIKNLLNKSFDDKQPAATANAIYYMRNVVTPTNVVFLINCKKILNNMLNSTPNVLVFCVNDSININDVVQLGLQGMAVFSVTYSFNSDDKSIQLTLSSMCRFLSNHTYSAVPIHIIVKFNGTTKDKQFLIIQSLKIMSINAGMQAISYEPNDVIYVKNRKLCALTKLPAVAKGAYYDITPLPYQAVSGINLYNATMLNGKFDVMDKANQTFSNYVRYITIALLSRTCREIVSCGYHPQTLDFAMLNKIKCTLYDPEVENNRDKLILYKDNIKNIDNDDSRSMDSKHIDVLVHQMSYNILIVKRNSDMKRDITIMGGLWKEKYLDVIRGTVILEGHEPDNTVLYDSNIHRVSDIGFRELMTDYTSMVNSSQIWRVIFHIHIDDAVKLQNVIFLQFPPNYNDGFNNSSLMCIMASEGIEVGVNSKIYDKNYRIYKSLHSEYTLSKFHAILVRKDDIMNVKPDGQIGYHLIYSITNSFNDKRKVKEFLRKLNNVKCHVIFNTPNLDRISVRLNAGFPGDKNIKLKIDDDELVTTSSSKRAWRDFSITQDEIHHINYTTISPHNLAAVFAELYAYPIVGYSHISLYQYGYDLAVSESVLASYGGMQSISVSPIFSVKSITSILRNNTHTPRWHYYSVRTAALLKMFSEYNISSSKYIIHDEGERCLTATDDITIKSHVFGDISIKKHDVINLSGHIISLMIHAHFASTSIDMWITHMMAMIDPTPSLKIQMLHAAKRYVLTDLRPDKNMFDIWHTTNDLKLTVLISKEVIMNLLGSYNVNIMNYIERIVVKKLST